jgi:dihydrolipoamide dehydrogenase
MLLKVLYDVVVIGGGPAGLTASSAAANLGAKTILIEKNRLGGDCTWYGCVPSKTLLKSAQVYSLVRRMSEFGISVGADPQYDPSRVMSHVRNMVAKISHHDAPEMFEKKGIRVLFGSPKFLDKHTSELNGEQISSKRFLICTGAEPFVPIIEGLDEISYLTNKNVFDLETLPKSLAIIGGGPIGVELAQAFSRLGVEVSIIESSDMILSREDPEISQVLSKALAAEGVKILTNRRAIRFSQSAESVSIVLESPSKESSTLNIQKVLVAAGRAPNVHGLDLEKAGVSYTAKGIRVDKKLRTTAKNIYACGDVVGSYQFTHVADYHAITAVQNALFPFKKKISYETIPWSTFTSPELARVGVTEDQARAKYKDVKVYKSLYSANDRAITDQEEEGMAKIICDRKGRILGAHIVGANAGELIHEYILAKSFNLRISKLAAPIHVYPTLAQIVKRTGEQYYLGLFSSWWFKRLTRTLVRMMR